MARSRQRRQTASEPQAPQAPQPLVFKPRHPEQITALRVLNRSSICFLSGPAGTAKTFLATYHALQKKRSGEVKKIIVSRPAVTQGAEIGFLPGSAEQKLNPFLQPIYEAGEKLTGSADTSIFEVLPLSYIRGRTIESAVLIVDEAQNLTPDEILTICTRLGENGKIIFSGDTMQNDLGESVLDLAAESMDGLEAGGCRVGRHVFSRDAIVRHPLTTLLIDAAVGSSWYQPVRRGR